MLQEASSQNDQDTGQCKANTAEQKLGEGLAGVDLKQLISDFDAGERTAPEKAAKRSQQADDSGLLHAFL